MDRPRHRPTQQIRQRIPMAMPPPGATPDTELVLYGPPDKLASQRHTVPDVGVIQRQMGDISPAEEENFEEVLISLGE